MRVLCIGARKWRASLGSEPFLEFDVICCLPCCKNALQLSLVAWALALNTAAAAAAADADAFDYNDDDDDDDNEGDAACLGNDYFKVA